MDELVSNVGKLAEGQAYIDQCLDTFTAEQRFHGERLAHIETKMNQILEKVGGGIDDIRNSMTSAVQSFENAKDTSVRWSAVSEVEHIFGQFNKNTSSLVPQEGKAFIDTRFAHCVLEPSSSKRIAFDMVAIGFLMYDLCYLRTTLFPDLLIVLIDWLTVFANVIFPEEEANQNPEMIGAKLVRFSKVTRTSWLNDPIRDENSPLYHDTLPLFQYTTAFHWALTQMTPGSMQVFPRNSLERLFNIFALVFGMIFFSSLISSLSATMVNFRMKSTQTANQMAELRRFLRQANISSKLAIGVQKEALERLMEVKPLMVIDVKALKLLSADLQKELQYELCLPFLMRSGFYRVCHAADTGALKSIMIGCMAFTVYNAGAGQ
eukprot:g14120.t1